MPNKTTHNRAKKIALTFCVFGVLASTPWAPAFAMNSVEQRQLKALDAQTRLEQRCDIEAIERLNKIKKWSVDKVLAYAYADPVTSINRIKAKGAAFRSRGKWYHLSYDCKATPDHMSIVSFTFTTGDIIPRDHWDRHYLVP